MQTFISVVFVITACLTAIPVAVLFVEVFAAIILSRPVLSLTTPRSSSPRVAVLVPAHNEASGVLATLSSIKAQLGAGDRVLVVADNCSDDTAAVAASGGAEVTIHNDPDKRGKGYALDWGLRVLAADPPDVVIVVDADCRLSDFAVERLATACVDTERPVQSLDLMAAPAESPIDFRAAQFAWRLKNFVRPLGLRALGLPCQLMGTGMAFPWNLISSIDLASGQIIEDLKLGLDLAMTGNPPIFYPFPGVVSDFPLTIEAAQNQRMRWEKGHIRAIIAMIPRVAIRALVRRDIGLLALALDAAVPPLSLLGILVISVSITTAFATQFGISFAAFEISSASLVALVASVFLSWLKYGRDVLPRRSVLLIFSYILQKLPLYRKMLSSGSGSQWIRTDRRKM